MSSFRHIHEMSKMEYMSSKKLSSVFWVNNILIYKNYLFDKKKGKTFFQRFFLGVKTAVLSRVRVENVLIFLPDMKFCFMKRLFPRPR
jgi:hypothetical protein